MHILFIVVPPFFIHSLIVAQKGFIVKDRYDFDGLAGGAG
jgi:hypothetical protein